LQSVTLDGLPASLQLKHSQFNDYLPIHPSVAEQTQLAQVLIHAVSQPPILSTLRFIRKRNHDSTRQPLWASISSRLTPEIWNYIWKWKFAERNKDVVLLSPRGSFILHMARYMK